MSDHHYGVEEHPMLDSWVVFANWSLGEISDAEYADYVEAQPDYDPEGPESILIDRLRAPKPQSERA